MTVVCGDSHTSTHGAFGALAFGIGTSEVEHVLATQTLPLKRFKTMAINVNSADGRLRAGVTSKDIILAVIAQIGTGGGQGYVLEYRGNVIENLSMEARMTICNMSIEAGARAGMIAPDETTFAYLKGRDHAPHGARLGRRGGGLARSCAPTTDAVFDAEVDIDADALTPFVTWGTNPGQGLPLSERVPDPEQIVDENERVAAEKALAYMGLSAGTPLREIARGHRVRRLLHQRPDRGPARRRPRSCDGRKRRRRRADAGRARLDAGAASRPRHEGLDKVFTAAGAEWRSRGLLDVPGHEPRPARARASAARRRPTATSRAGRARAAAPTWCRRWSPPRPRCAAR